MFGIFKNSPKSPPAQQSSSFEYLPSDSYYFDSACTTLRPKQVIEAETEYYQNYNSCGHRVKYKWGLKTDKKVDECRQSLLKLAGKNDKDYTVAFCLNTTAGINQILHQIDPKQMGIKKIIISDIDHNSVFLPSITFAQRNTIARQVFERGLDGSLDYDPKNLENALVITNTQSNIDGRELHNLEPLSRDVRAGGGLLLLDACQSFGHNPDILKNVDFDAAFGSGHKMYGPSVGFMIIKKSLVKSLDCFLIGGSTVNSVGLDNYALVEDENEIYARIEPGLQNYGGIIGLNEAILWRQNWKGAFEQNLGSHTDGGPNILEKISAKEYESKLANYLNQKLKSLDGKIKLLNQNPSSVVSLYPNSSSLDGHKLAVYLGEAGIMCRSGYHCCHYYLKEKMKLPPLFRISFGLNNTPAQVDYLIEKMKLIL